MIIAPDGCVNMAKPILFAAAAGAVAIFYLIAPSSASYSYASSSATSSGSYASASSESYAIATSGSEYYPPPPCDAAPNTKSCRPQKPKCYSKYEVFSNCPATVCRPKKCDEVGYPVACVDLNPNEQCPVPPGCICVENYVRNHKGICIPMKNCPSCGGDRNAESGCNSICNQLCSKLNEKPVACTAECVYNSCECKKGYVFDEVKNKCVHPSHCTCKSNEVYTDCEQAKCGPKTCAQLMFPVHCLKIDPKYCTKGCICIEGYVRNKYGECIPKDQCPPICGPYEFPSNCMQADCAPQNCTQLGFPLVCVRVDQKHCKKGCLCKEGYARNSDGVCIPVKECPSCGGDPNAESAECASNCGRLCSNYDKTDVVCTLECPINGCQCKEGYVYDSNTNRCVLPCDCTPTCGPHEVYSNCMQGDCAPKNCTELGFPIACPRVDPKYCKKGCLCKPGYVRNSAGICIPVKKCPSCGGDPNAEGAECASNCGRLCSNYDKKDVVCTLECVINGCQCKEGYVYDSNTHRCVLPCDCTPTCGPHEVYNNCMQGDCAPKKCTELGFPIACPRVDPKYCKKGCLCEPGYVRNSAGVCIPVKKCPSCGGDPNAEGAECASNCGRLCSNYDKTDVVCTLECVINGCQCKKGFVYDSNTHRCVLPCDCTSVCKEYEMYSECINNPCPVINCSHVGLWVDCLQFDTKGCIKGCVCKKPLMREDDGSCVPIEECKTPVCKENEVYSDCINGGCTPKNCSQLGQPKKCVKIDPKYCIKGCLCKEGYLREDDGTCVPEKKCKKKCTKPNEYYECCGYDCPSQSCKSINKTQHCPIQTTDNCKPLCKCKDGFFRNLNGECITKKQCLQCPGPHEYWSCGGACDNVCKDMHKQNQTNCPIVNVRCNEMCYCEKNYARAKNGTCIPIKRCNEPQCRKNERYEKCPARLTEPQKCSELGWPLPDPCTVDDKCPVKPACVCISGYVRNDKGVCIPKKDCPDCGGDPNAKPGCGINCNKKCEDLGSEPVFCITLCKENSCDCKDGYYYDKEKKKCVPPCECPPVCKKNEVYSDCINGGCTPKNCSQLGQPKICVKIDPKYCIKGCLCKEGYLREDDGTCVPEKKCKKKCTKPNEYYECCGYDCPSQSCKSINKTQHCPIQTTDNCKPLCKCKDGFFRNLNGECITKKQCLQCPGPHEYWSCGGACDNVCKDMHKQNQTNCPIVNVKCNEMCYCEKNYARAKNGTCIPIKKCNEPQCGKNERYEKCPARLTEPQKCSELGWPLPDPCSDDDKCPVKPACVCISGYVRNDKGVCIPKKDCPKCGGDSNAESGCGTNCNKKCEDILKKPGACILICKNNACDCKEGYYYNAEKKKCVLPSECNICTKPNEYLEMCDYGCPPNTCESLGMVYACPIRERNKCTPRCKCKSGFLRNKNGECITEEQCRKCKGPHEYWSCGGACDNVCKDMHKQNQTNCPIVNIKCNEMCYCEKDYARAKNGTCIPINKCNEPQCGKNERYEKCPARLTEPQKCSELGWPLPDPCTDDDKCPVKPACVCISGYVRNDKGVCIPKEDCPDCGGDPNAKPGCGINCNKKCEDLGSEPVFCITLCKENSCDCKDGYYYDKEKKKCVPACECPGVCPGANEAYEDCTNPRCRPMKCSEVGFPLNCTEPPACKKGCACKDGYVRNKKGTCVTLKECGTCGGDKNAESGSGVNCLKKCYDLQYPEKPKPCPKIWKFNACDCKKGFYLDEDKKKCVRARDCPHYCPENEVYDFCNNGGCGHRNCSELNGPILCIDPIECYGGCTCKEGYLRLDATGKCVPEDQCPESCTKPNEIYVKCPPKCPPQTCKSLNETFHCPLIKTKIKESDCIGECRCKENYYRNLIGECIRKEDCLKCTGAHEYFSCGPACDNVCCDLDTKSKDNCPIKNVKCEEMCYCEDGYARDKDGVCICISDCPDRTTTTPKPCE